MENDRSANDLAHQSPRSATSHRARLVLALGACLVADVLANFAPGPAAVVARALTGVLAVFVIVLLVRTRRTG